MITPLQRPLPPLRGVVSDLDGVVYRGERPIEGAVAAFRAWRQAGIPYAFVTNNATKSAEDFAAKLRRLGVEAEAAQVFCAVAATTSLMRRRWSPGTRVFSIGGPVLAEAVEAAGFEPGGEEAEVVVLGFDDEFSYAKLRTAVRAALAGAALVVTNPDMLTPADDGFEPCVGVLMAAVTAAVPTVEPIVVGKPEPLMIEEALAHLGTPREGTVMIGDQVATDILAGQRAGLFSILVQTGVPPRALPGTTPDRIVTALTEIGEG